MIRSEKGPVERWGTGYRFCGTCDVEMTISGTSYCTTACAIRARDRRLRGEAIRDAEHKSDK